MFFFKKNKLDNSIKLSDVVEKVTETEFVFWNINDDLAIAADTIMQSTPLVKMAYGYARRVAAAGLYIQGLADKGAYSHALAMFKALQLQTGHTADFQELAAAQSEEYMQTYQFLITKPLVSTIILIAQEFEIPPGKKSDAQLFESVVATMYQNQ